MGFKDLIMPSNNNASVALFDLISHEDWQLVVMECRMWPNEAKKWKLREGFFDGEHDSHVLPIHMACALQCPPEVVDTLVECHPMGVRMREETFQRLPLHVACQTNAPLETIEALIHHYPEASRAKDCAGRLPIHYACSSHDAESVVIDLLLQAFPASAGCGDENGWLPIHVACSRGVSLYAVEMLLKYLPQSAEMATNKGSTPLICARKGNSKRHNDVVRYLKDYIQRQSSMNRINRMKLEPTSTLITMGMPASTTIHHRNVAARGA